MRCTSMQGKELTRCFSYMIVFQEKSAHSLYRFPHLFIKENVKERLTLSQKEPSRLRNDQSNSKAHRQGKEHRAVDAPKPSEEQGHRRDANLDDHASTNRDCYLHYATLSMITQRHSDLRPDLLCHRHKSLEILVF